jgi:hypothetical protein
MHVEPHRQAACRIQRSTVVCAAPAAAPASCSDLPSATSASAWVICASL